MATNWESQVRKLLREDRVLSLHSELLNVPEAVQAMKGLRREEWALLLEERFRGRHEVAEILSYIPEACEDRGARAIMVRELHADPMHKIALYLESEDIEILFARLKHDPFGDIRWADFWETHLEALAEVMTQEQLSAFLNVEDRKIRLQVIYLLSQRRGGKREWDIGSGPSVSKRTPGSSKIK